MVEELPIIPTCGAVLLNVSGDVVLVEHREGAHHLTGTFGLPSGKIKPGESSVEAIVREIEEETGIIVNPGALTKLPTVYHAIIEQKDGLKNFSWDVYTAVVTDTGLRESEETKPQWKGVAELDSLRLLPNVKNAITEAISQHMSPGTAA